MGFLLPAELALMGGATAYNVFHLAAAAVGLIIGARRSPRSASTFNVVCSAPSICGKSQRGLLAGSRRAFALQPADHVVHALVGALLVRAGYLGKTVS